MNQTAIIEAILFVAAKPMSLTSLAKAAELDAESTLAALEVLSHQYEERESGLAIARTDSAVQLVTAPALADTVSHFQEKEYTGDLTKAQLETLTVIAYQQPITRPELEEIRGVNSAVILRTLLLRGLITERADDAALLPVYELTIDALRQLGIADVSELPEYDTLNAHPHITPDDAYESET
jgi:segregation and condensation protein B